MRVASEFIYDESRILIRLLGDATPVQTGSYRVDFFPTKKPFIFDIDSDQIINNEAKIYITNVNPFPEQIKITLPDLTSQSAVTNLVKKPPPEDLLIEQPQETITPKEQKEHNPAGPYSKINEMSPPDFPTFWLELNFANANPVRLAEGMTGSLLSYVGGGEGRAVSASIIQSSVNDPPYKKYAPTILEGMFTNSLENSDFSSSYRPSGFIDNVPTGWTINQKDQKSLIRVVINPEIENFILPLFQVVWYLRPGFIDVQGGPPITLLTPDVGANQTFQVILEPAQANSYATAQLISANGVVSSPVEILDGPKVLTLNVGSDPGRVKILWNQTEGNSAMQLLNVIAPMAASYNSPHTYIPSTGTSNADVITLQDVEFSGRYAFKMGTIRVVSVQETIGKPISWEIKSELGPVLLKINNGILESDFSSQTINLVPLLPTDTKTMGNYSLRWTSGQDFSLTTTPVFQGVDTKVDISFSLDLPIPDTVLDAKINYEFKSFSANEGSSSIRYFTFKPE